MYFFYFVNIMNCIKANEESIYQAIWIYASQRFCKFYIGNHKQIKAMPPTNHML